MGLHMLSKQKTSIENDIDQEKVQYLQKDNSSDMLKAMEILQNPPNIESNTILTDNEQVNALTLMNWAGQVYEIDFFIRYANSYPRYKISGDDGRGRREIIQIAEAIRRDEMEKHNNLMEVLTGRK